jgi:hypothetical protein
MELAIPIVLGLIVIGVVVVVALAAMARGANVRKEAIADPDVETLRYAVPTGQDPAVLTTALLHEGYEATSEPAPHGHDLLVACPPGQRDRIRDVISRTDTASMEGPGPRLDTGRVRFADE